MTKPHFLLFVTLLLSSLTNAQPSSDQLNGLFDDYANYLDNRRPRLEHPDPSMRIGGFMDITPDAYQQRVERLEQFLQRLEKLKSNQLTDQQIVNAEMFEFQVGSAIRRIQNQQYLMPMLGDTGFYFQLLRLGEVTEINSEAEAAFYLQQLKAIPDYLNQWQSNLRLAIDIKKTMPSVVLVDFEKPLEAFVATEVDNHPLLKPFLAWQDSNGNLRHVKEAKRILSGSIYPAIGQFVEFLKDEYLPAGRESIAIEDMPDGADYYADEIYYYTTLKLTADQIHLIGLKEVKRIRTEMEQVIKASGFEGNFAEFIEFLRTDPQFYAETPEELLKEAAYISKKADAILPKFFSHLPRQPYGVEPVPDSIAPRYTTGRYVGAPLDSKRGGTYWVNTYALEKRPLYVLEALTLHEAVPGHHLQNALTKELDSLPDFRRNTYLSAYGEGWALYTEKLGIEAGFYQDYYSQFGRLSYEMWRAIRLVVDTGMHAKGWSREKAIDYMASNTALSKHNVTTEIDRYIAWPGQALSYKLGELKIVELRQRAEQVLGKAFDIREFHDQILSYGPVTLEILDRLINQWINETELRD